MQISKIISVRFRKVFFLFFLILASRSALAANIAGVVQTADGIPICALAVANGQSMFTCDPVGEFSFTDLPLAPDGSIQLQLYADGFYPNIVTHTDFSDKLVTMKPAQICEGGGELTNKQQTEKMIGSWFFRYTIITPFDHTYSFFGSATPSTTDPDLYVMLGTDEYGNRDVLVQYDDADDDYYLLDESTIIDYFYVYDFNSSTTVSGCYYQVTKSTGDFSQCYSFAGSLLNTSLSTANKTFQSSLNSKQLDAETREVQEVEAFSMARAGLTASSVESTEDSRKRGEAKKIYEQLRETIQAR